ncbi:hypothetical protein HPB50_011344 [Hyalomma asiaticum]|uniref:Uncharacterized protein n=1 Tax=Hyalomma asiaticum TaxID=266040 RepID=A0ACB7S1X7_HYAAI|nr:hypothetical protein HPB50_011344 [Hyalomma asiaticum]
MNGFNLTSRLFGFYDRLRRFEVAEAVPDVYDLTKWVSNRRTSDGIVMGLASVSLLFDVVLFTGALKRDIFLIEISGLWGAVDCIADAVIGFLSANYTLPPFGVHHLKRLQASQVNGAGFLLRFPRVTNFREVPPLFTKVAERAACGAAL